MTGADAERKFIRALRAVPVFMLASVVYLGVYMGAYYATIKYDGSIIYPSYRIGDYRFPDWLDDCFCFAKWVDSKIRSPRPPHK